MRYELHTRHPDSPEQPGGLFCFTDSPRQAMKWQLKGGVVVDTGSTLEV